jgi:GTPase SAR1 family protein
VPLKDKAFSVNLVVVSPDPQWMHARPMVVAMSCAVILCYSVTDRNSYNSIQQIWFPLTQVSNPKRPFFLLGLKTDIRDMKGWSENPSATRPTEFVSTEEGMLLASQIGASSFSECSSLDYADVDDVFVTMCNQTLDCEDYTKIWQQVYGHSSCVIQ